MALKTNVGTFERTASVVLGGLALTQAVTSRNSLAVRSAAGSTGLALLWRGLSGNCALYSGLNVTTAGQAPNKPQTIIERSALVNLPIEEVSAYLESGQGIYGPFVSTGENIFEINLDGRLWMLNLKKHADGVRTLIRMSWDDHGHTAGAADELKNATQAAPRILELRKLKSLLETGEIATVEGQSHGERSAIGSFFENFGDFIIEKIQSKSSLPEDPHFNTDVPAKKTHMTTTEATV